MELTVNDALISTDIDRLIRFISEKQKTTMKEVQQNTGVDKKLTIDSQILFLYGKV